MIIADKWAGFVKKLLVMVCNGRKRTDSWCGVWDLTVTHLRFCELEQLCLSALFCCFFWWLGRTDSCVCQKTTQWPCIFPPWFCKYSLYREPRIVLFLIWMVLLLSNRDRRNFGLYMQIPTIMVIRKWGGRTCGCYPDSLDLERWPNMISAISAGLGCSHISVLWHGLDFSWITLQM